MLPAVTVPPPGSSWVYDEFAELVRCLERIPDVRKPRGKRHPLAGVLALVVLGLMGECRSLSAIRRFGRCHPEVLSALGLRSVPSVPTLSRVLAGLRAEALRDALRDFTRALAVEREATMGVVAVDGKTLRGVHEGESPAHLLHLFAHESGLVLDQLLVDSVRDEVTAAQRWIETLAQTFPGLRVLTADALYADRDLCATIVGQEYAYLIRLKKTSARC
jgi:hypothetical protein